MGFLEVAQTTLGLTTIMAGLVLFPTVGNYSVQGRVLRRLARAWYSPSDGARRSHAAPFGWSQRDYGRALHAPESRCRCQG